MPEQLAKSYEPKSVQSDIEKLWIENRAFHAEPTDPGTPYSIVIPPPNVTAALHLGHALNNTLQDILIRVHRMRGENAVWIPGTDHAGIATQTVVEKRVLKEEGKRRTEFKREDFVAKIQAWKDEYEQRIIDQLKAMGCSCDFERQAFTMDEPRARAVREAFFQLFKDGLIYRGKRLVNWDPATQTALADDEVEMEEVDGFFYYLRYPLVDSERAASVSESVNAPESADRSLTVAARYITVATTRPETMLGDTAVAINPRDPRAAGLRGKFVRLPIVNRIIPIIEDDYVVLPDASSDDPKAKFATGFLKVTPAHDTNDYEIGQRHNLPIINILAPDGSISDKHGWNNREISGNDADFAIGLDRYEAREAIVEWFKKNKLLEDVKPYKHSVGHSYRSHVAIEPYLSDQWYCKVTDDRMRGAALRAIAPDQYDNPTSRDREGAEPAPHEDPNHATLQTSRDREGAEPAPHEDSNDAALQTSRDREGAGSSSREEPVAHARGSSSAPLAYFITFTTYGSWLHGDDRSSADRAHNLPGTPYLVGDESREKREFESLKQPPTELDEPQRTAVQAAIAQVCEHRVWTLIAVHVRSQHVHAVVIADASPEKVMNDFKSYATRRLRELQLVDAERRVWTRHGSTRYLNDDAGVVNAGKYVIEDQGAQTSPLPIDRRGIRTTLTSRDREGADSRSSASSDGASQPLPDGRGSLSEGNHLRFYPARYAKTFQTWHENIRDWCISRQLWWGHRIPVWHFAFNATNASVDFSREIKALFAHMNENGIPSDDLVITPDSRDGFFLTGRSVKSDTVFAAIGSAGKLIDGTLVRACRQDPDVLDTWFSSALWPMSTLGWPGMSAEAGVPDELEVWNPTSVLSTAREIITLWVSRMVMFNAYFLDRLPFKDVFIHAMVQDGDGRKMSKSLGNGVDPLDIIDSHGCDAMRFTLASMATNTQDVRMPVERDPTSGKNTSSKFDVGRNFANKLWNAARFVLMSIEKLAPEPVDESKWSMADRWIVSRFNRTIEEANEALANYRFDQYARACYDFFWRDFCDWYVEASKPSLRDPARAAQTANILAATLDGALRLLHPLVPFVTEAVWQKLCETRIERGIPGRIMGCTSPLLIKAAWPTVGDFSQAAEHIWPRVQEVVGAIRNVRNEHKVDPKRPINVSIKAPGDSARQLLAHQKEIEILATCKLIAVSADLAAPENATTVQAAGCDIYLEGFVDKAAESQRNDKRREELAKSVAAMKGRLANEGYIAKAPPKLVRETQDQLAAAEAELAKLG